MVANKLPATVLAQVFLLVIAGFAVSLYILPTATGTANGILSFHTSNIPCLRCFLFARRLSAYILGHHQKSVGTLLDYGHAAGETLVQAVIEDRALGKPLHLADDDQTLIFKAVAAK